MTTDKPVADDALPEPVAYGLSSADYPGHVLSATTDREAAMWSDWEPLYTADQMHAAIARAIERTIRIQNENL